MLGSYCLETLNAAVQNSLATVPMLLLMLINSETKILMSAALPTAGVVALVLSCAGGLGMSYFSFALRAVISATSFSVIGNICKVLTILVNIMMWDQHASESSFSLLQLTVTLLLINLRRANCSLPALLAVAEACCSWHSSLSLIMRTY